MQNGGNQPRTKAHPARTRQVTHIDRRSSRRPPKTTVAGAAVKEDVTYHYNLAGRLDKVTTDDQSGTEHVVEYIYNDEGIRVWAYSYDQPTGGGTKTLEKTIVYLVDSHNHTGYAQVLEEMTFNKADPDPLTETPDSLTTYVIGDDVLAQATNSDTPKYLLYDGHGSTRQLAEYDTAVTIADTFSYDAYGVLLQDNAVASSNPGKVGAQQTSLLYAGEHFDTDSQHYYLRARYYDPLNGRFNRMDPFAGNNQDPQSLHKYNYTYNNPINAIDPTGNFEFSLAGLMQNMTIGALVEQFVMPKVAPYAEKAATLFVPAWLRQAISGETPSAYLIGGSVSASAGWGLGVGLLGGVELLWASVSNKYVAYTYTGVTGGIMSGRGGAATVGGYLGAVWGAKSSVDYSGRSQGVSFPFGHLATGLRRNVATKISKYIHKVFDAPPEYRLINAANEAAAKRIAYKLGPRSNFEASFFWNDSQTVGGVLIGAEINIGKSFMVSGFSTTYRQVWPEQEVPFF